MLSLIGKKKNLTNRDTLILETIWSWPGRWVGVGGSWHAEGPCKSLFLLLVRKEIIRLMHTLSVSLSVFQKGPCSYDTWWLFIFLGLLSFLFFSFLDRSTVSNLSTI